MAIFHLEVLINVHFHKQKLLNLLADTEEISFFPSNPLQIPNATHKPVERVKNPQMWKQKQIYTLWHKNFDVFLQRKYSV